MELPKGRMSGPVLKAVVASVRHTPARHVVARVLRKQLGIDALRNLDRELRSGLRGPSPLQARTRHERPSQSLGLTVPSAWPRTVQSYAKAYREGTLTAEEVVERSLAAARFLAARNPSLGPILEFDDDRAMDAARRSMDRVARGEALGPLDGIPVAIKEEVRVRGLPCQVGTRHMSRDLAEDDCVAVARLRAAGAVVIGTTPMTEYGMSPLGGNVHRIMPRNPHDPSRLPGGSSSGSGVAVATGVVPLALGADGGGSIRIPACFNGVFGLKPTFGRVPTTGHGLDGGSTVVHLGPLGASSHDLAVFLEATAGYDDGDPDSQQPVVPAGAFTEALGRGVQGLRIGVIESEWAACEADIARPAREALDALEREGATLVPISVPLASSAAAMGYLTIGLETHSALLSVRQGGMDELGLDLQMLLANLDTFRPDDYLDAQRLRTTLRLQVRDALKHVDVVALPTTAIVPPTINEAEELEGFVDPPALDGACRFAFLGNLTGCPAGTAPVGTSAGLPVGLQILGDAYDEACVLQVLAHLERIGAARCDKPAAHLDLFES
ncbi:MAG: amidase [Polyangiaceae bacterium]